MNRVVLTESMRDSALKNVRKKRSAPKARQWSWEKSLVLAASFVIVLTAAIVFPNLNRGPEVEGPVTYGVTQSATQSGGSVNRRQPAGPVAGRTNRSAQNGEGRESYGQQAGASNTGQNTGRQGTVQQSNGQLAGSGQPSLKSASPQRGPVLESANDESSVQAIGPQTVNSRSALERRIGHRLKMPSVLPFSASQFLYTDYGDGMGGVTESSGNSEIETRMAKISDTKDPSGDYTVYNTTKVKNIKGRAVTLKGNDGRYQLAVWNDGVYSYSIRSNKPLTEAEMIELVRSMK